MAVLSATLLLPIMPAAPTLAGPVLDARMVWTDEARTRAELLPLDGPSFDQRAVNWNYDNWRDWILGGNSEDIGLFRVGGDEFGDDMHLVNSPGRLVGDGTSLAHMGTTGRCLELTKTNRWYDGDGNLLREFSYRVGMSAVNFGPGAAYRVVRGDGFWTFLNLMLPERIFATEELSDPVGMDIADFGKIIAGPRTIGYSSRFIYNFTAGRAVDLGSDQVNLAHAIRSDPIPAPGALPFLALAALPRRRR